MNDFRIPTDDTTMGVTGNTRDSSCGGTNSGIHIHFHPTIRRGSPHRVRSRRGFSQALEKGNVGANDILEEQRWIYKGTTISNVVPMFLKQITEN